MFLLICAGIRQMTQVEVFDVSKVKTGLEMGCHRFTKAYRVPRPLSVTNVKTPDINYWF